MTRSIPFLIAATAALLLGAEQGQARGLDLRTDVLGNTVTACSGDGAVCAASIGPAQAGGESRTGAGVAVVELDEGAGTLHFDIRIGGLSAPEVAAHIHGPAAPGTDANIVYTLPVGDHKVGEIVLTDVGSYTVSEQLADLNAGLWYVNIHTFDGVGGGFPLGEIRGQIDLRVIPQLIAGQPSSASAWTIRNGNVMVFHFFGDHFLVTARVNGLVLDLAGFNPSPDFLVRLFCHDNRGAPVLAATTRAAPLSLGNPDPSKFKAGGNGKLFDVVRLPEACFAPIALIGGSFGPTGNSPSNWFAVGGF